MAEGDFPVIGPECFTNSDTTVISYKGENYYRACGVFVADLPDGGQSSCVKRVNHPHISHEDYDGRTKTRVPGDEVWPGERRLPAEGSDSEGENSAVSEPPC